MYNDIGVGHSFVLEILLVQLQKSIGTFKWYVI